MRWARRPSSHCWSAASLAGFAAFAGVRLVKSDNECPLALAALSIVRDERYRTPQAARWRNVVCFRRGAASRRGSGLIGGIPFFLVALAQIAGKNRCATTSGGASLMSVRGVAAIFAGGTALAVDYVGALALMYGTSYGVMLTAKILFAMLLALGALNFPCRGRPAQDREGGDIAHPLLSRKLKSGMAPPSSSAPPHCVVAAGARSASERATFAEIVDWLELRACRCG